MEFNWRRLVVNEYGTTYIWMIAIILVVLKNLWLSGHYQPGDPLVWTLWALFGLVSVAYAVARYLKKARILSEEAAR